LEKLKEIWNKLNPDQKKKYLKIGLAVALVVVAAAMYKVTRSGPPKTKQAVEKKKDISLEPKILEKSMYNEAQKNIGKISELEKSVEQLKKDIEEKNKQKDVPDPAKPNLPALPPPGQAKPGEPLKAQQAMVQNQSPQVPNLPKPGSYNIPPPPGVPAAGSIQPPPAPRTEIFGEIEIVSQRSDTKDPKEDKKKDVMKVYLPPSFMEGTLLSGLDAPTSEGGKGQPAPVILRVKDLAVLPNRVKADLKGCFVIGEGHGNLADERAHIRLTTLSCVTRNGESVIDQKVKGFLVDKDGKIGLGGTVVAKMGAHLARSLLAGFIMGFGSAVKTSTVSTTVSGLGTTQTLDTDKAWKAGVGEGIYSAAKDLQKFYLDLGKQTMPVVEVGAMKNVTIVFSEGVDLEIKDKNMKLRKGTYEKIVIIYCS